MLRQRLPLRHDGVHRVLADGAAHQVARGRLGSPRWRNTSATSTSPARTAASASGGSSSVNLTDRPGARAARAASAGGRTADGGRGERRHRHAAAHQAGEGRQVVLGRPQHRGQRRRVACEDPARLGEGAAAALADQQRRAGLPLQAGHLLADRLLGGAQACGGRRQGAGLADGVQHQEASRVHRDSVHKHHLCPAWCAAAWWPHAEHSTVEG